MQGGNGYYSLIIKLGEKALTERNGGTWWRDLEEILQKQCKYTHFMKRACMEGRLFWVDLVHKLKNDSAFKAEFLHKKPKLEPQSFEWWQGFCKRHCAYTEQLVPTHK